MTDLDNIVSAIFHYIKDNGELTNQAQSDWGQDRWEYKGLVAGLSDGGYTQMVGWGDRLRVYNTYNRPLVFYRGDENELKILYEGIKHEL